MPEKSSIKATDAEATLCQQFETHYGFPVSTITRLAAHASSRKIFRLSGKSKEGDEQRAIGVWHQNDAENNTFISFAKHFASHGLPVPKVHAFDVGLGVYLQDDLGIDTLADLLARDRKETGELSEHSLGLLTEAAALLPRFQLGAAQDFPFEQCLGHGIYGKEAMAWDLNSFLFSFLRPLGVDFNQRAITDELTALSEKLLSAPADYFLHRDFQTRNMVVSGDALSIIDFQSGFQGPLQYDLASFLYQGSAKLSDKQRKLLLDEYCKAASAFENFDEKQFRELFPSFALLFLLKVLGTYGLKGLYEQKLYFLKGIELATDNVQSVFSKHASTLQELPNLRQLFEDAIPKHLLTLGLAEDPAPSTDSPAPLKVEIMSFSYRAGIPRLNPLHGGGFVFDCRFLPNPHRDPELRDFTGRDQPIHDYFENSPEMEQFLAQTLSSLRQAIASYRRRGFGRLSIAFGCTGGRHRSVYSAEQIKRRLSDEAEVEFSLEHREIPALAPKPDGDESS